MAHVPVPHMGTPHTSLNLGPWRGWLCRPSHLWRDRLAQSTGQDQSATIKRQLTVLLPGVRVFLDTDDLKDIDKIEEYVGSSANIMIFVSAGCELHTSLNLERLTATHTTHTHSRNAWQTSTR